MMEFNSALFILMAEGLIAAIVIALVLFVRARNKHGKDMVAIDKFISQLAKDEILKTRLMETLLLEKCGVDRATADAVIAEISSAERSLWHHIIQLQLKSDPALLKQIDQLISNLTNPYCKLLTERNVDFKGLPIQERLTPGETENKIHGLSRVNQQLTVQLDNAMHTIDEITAEYTRVFSGNQSALELQNSAKKMLAIFQEIEQRLKNNIAEMDS